MAPSVLLHLWTWSVKKYKNSHFLSERSVADDSEMSSYTTKSFKTLHLHLHLNQLSLKSNKN